MADVFMSYHDKSAGELAEQIADALEDAGISCWYMGRDSVGAYAGQITREICACSVFVLILDEGSNKSKHVQNEVSIAFQEEKFLLPFRVDNCKLSDDLRYYLNRFTIIKANSPDERRIERIVKRIAQTLNRKPQPPKASKPQPPPVAQTQPSAKIVKRGVCGDSVNFTLDENGVLTISGTGAMRDDMWLNSPWYDYCETISHVEIQNGVTMISTSAFSDCTELTSVSIPDSVTSIEVLAFFNCGKLKSVSVPARATVNDFAFPDTVRVTYRA